MSIAVVHVADYVDVKGERNESRDEILTAWTEID